MKTHIIEAGVVVNTILATVAEAESAFPSAICVAGDTGGIGWAWDGATLTAPAVPPLTPEEQAKLIDDKIDALWRAADTYVSGYISGVAIGILTIGVIQQKPKCLAVTQWSSSIWESYYTRKALVTTNSIDDLDFSGSGAMPYSVPELQAEVFSV